MKKLIVSLALASSALIAAAPASAQYYGNRPNYDRGYEDRGYQDRGDDRGYDRGFQGGDVRQRLDRIAMRIDRSEQRGDLTRGEAQRLRYELNNVQRLAQRYSYDGLNGRERGDLERRINWLQQRLQQERFDGDRRGWRG